MENYSFPFRIDYGIMAGVNTYKYYKTVLNLLSRSGYIPLKKRELAKSLFLEEAQFEEFYQALHELEEQGRIRTGAGQKITLPPMPKRITGTFEMARKGYGFIRPEEPFEGGDVFVPEGANLDAVSGDKVSARVSTRGKGDGKLRSFGQIDKIIQRGRTSFVGTLEQQDRTWFVRPDGRENIDLIVVEDPGAKNAKAGDKVVVEIINYPTKANYAFGVILEKLGRGGQTAVELKSVITRFGLQEAFSRKALHQVRQVTHAFNPQEDIDSGRRLDLRDTAIITIDPLNARDFDDAVSLERDREGHWVLGVHIADVASFVTDKSPLDEDARLRATSVYLPQHVVPMLPEQLSNGICSLQPGQERFAKSAFITLDSAGRAIHTRFANVVIRSIQRFTYEEVDRILDKTLTGLEGFEPRALELVNRLEKLARILNQRRLADGMLRLELPKAELVFDDAGQVIDARPESTTFSHTMVEMFMLEANEAVARLLDGLNVPFLRRIHPQPDALAAGDMAKSINLCGYVIPKNLNRQGMQALLDSVKGKPESFMINLAILKSLQKAEYSPAHIGHFALASVNYCHFTSPIRRYPDLTVHRLLDAWLEKRLTKKTTADFPDYPELEELGSHCSRQERNAERAESDLRDYKVMQLLANHAGSECRGVITAITNFGMFVQLEKYLVEGLISDQAIFTFMKKIIPVKSRGKARPKRNQPEKLTELIPFKLGHELTVKIVDVNLQARTITLEPVANPATLATAVKIKSIKQIES